MLIAQLCSTTLPYCSWFLDCNVEMIEMTEAEDTETEKEGDADEKEKKLQADLNLLYYSNALLSKNGLDIYDIETIHHSEITTPPPEHISFIG